MLKIQLYSEEEVLEVQEKTLHKTIHKAIKPA